MSEQATIRILVVITFDFCMLFCEYRKPYWSNQSCSESIAEDKDLTEWIDRAVKYAQYSGLKI